MRSTRVLRCARRSVPPLTLLRLLGRTGSVADVLVDTDIFIDHLRGAAELKPGRN